MSVEKLQQDILRCKYVVSNIEIKHYSQNSYTEIVSKIFVDIFEDYIKDSGKIKGIHTENQCPDKLEPNTKSDYLPKKSLEKIQLKYGLNRSEK